MVRGPKRKQTGRMGAKKSGRILAEGPDPSGRFFRNTRRNHELPQNSDEKSMSILNWCFDMFLNDALAAVWSVGAKRNLQVVGRHVE